MTDATGAVFVDLDRTLIRSASGPVLQAAMVAEGVLSAGRRLPGERYLYGFYNSFGETMAFMSLARAAARLMRGRSADAVRRAGEAAVETLIDLVQPWALETLGAHRAEGRLIVLATTSPLDLVGPLARALDFDDVIATRYEEVDGSYTGRLAGRFAWGLGKRDAVREWAASNCIDLADCHVYSDSVFDVPVLGAVGHPHAVNADPRLTAVALARHWPLENWDRPPGVPSIMGLEPYHLVRPFLRPESFPYARFTVDGLEHIPSEGPVILVSNHRSYFDVAALALVGARMRRPVRFLGKRELFDAPVVGQLARAFGGIPVDRDSSPGDSMRQATAALQAGEAVIVLPQGTIPRGEAFFEPVLKGKTGAARLAAATGAPVVPIALWGTERVWARSSRVPNMVNLQHPPRVTVTVGPPVGLGLTDAVADTATLMAAIVDLLPDEAREQRVPTEEELAATRPSA
ncbi:MAG: HAD-IB family hydrolase [Acidimicrobiales bacterium]|jgi:putative phosphoserine phosphatase/1-acylglycerol-3-phosphate O-acyltransferase